MESTLPLPDRVQQWFLYALVAWMFFQMVAFHLGGSSWVRRAKILCYIKLVSVFGAGLLVLGSMIWHFSTNYQASASQPAAQHSAGVPAPVAVLLILGALRSIADLVTPVSVQRKSIFTVYTAGLLFALLVDRVQQLSGVSGLLTTPWSQSDSSAIVVSIILLAAVSVLFTFSLIYRQLRDVEQFPAEVARRHLFTPDHLTIRPAIHLQAVLIGPKESGKTSLVRSLLLTTKFPGQATREVTVYTLPYSTIGGDINTVFRVADPANSVQGRIASTFRSGINSRSYTRPSAPVLLSLVDTPGEYISVHLAAATKYRTDALFVLLNSSWLSSDWDQVEIDMTSGRLFRDGKSARFFNQQSPACEAAIDYFEALERATSTPASRTKAQLEQVYQVRTLCLLVYDQANRYGQVGATAASNFAKFAFWCGQCFGIEDEIPTNADPAKVAWSRMRVTYAILPLLGNNSGMVGGQQLNAAAAGILNAA